MSRPLPENADASCYEAESFTNERAAEHLKLQPTPCGPVKCYEEFDSLPV